MTTRGERAKRSVRGVRAEQDSIAPSVKGGFQERVTIEKPFDLKGISHPVALAAAVDEALNSIVNQINVIMMEKLRMIDMSGRVRADSFTDESGRPIALHRSTDETQVTAEEVIQAVDVKDNLGGVAIPEVLASLVEYADEATVESLKPAEAGAETTTGKSLTVMVDRVVASITDAGALAIEDSVDLSTSQVTNKTADNISETAGKKWAAETGANVTETRVAASVSGQGALATKGSVDLSSGEVTNKLAANLQYADSSTMESLKPAVAGADVTSANVAASVAGQGALATKGSVDLSSGEVTNKQAANIQYASAETLESLKPAAAGADVTLANTAAAITGQGALATKGTVAAGDIDTGAVTNSKIGAGAVDTAELATNAVTSSEIAPGAVGSSEISAGAVDSSELASSSVTNAKIGTNAVQAAQIKAGAVGNSECAWGTGYTPSSASDSIGKLINAVDEIQNQISGDYTITKTVTGGVPES